MTRRHPALATALCLVTFAAHAQPRPPSPPAAPAAPSAPLTVQITAPNRGVTQSDTVMSLEATVSDPTIREARLTVHGITYEVPVEDGHIRQNIVVLPGQNRVGVTVVRGETVVRDSATFWVEGEPVDLVVLLGWSSAREIIDLWVREPGGETCKWDHRETPGGGRLLDFSADAIGFGSQGYLRPRVAAGRYRVKVHYWSDGARRERVEGGDLDALLTALHDAETAQASEASDAHRAAVQTARERLDAWAAPAGVQTPLHAEVLLFPNTPHERRWRFDITAQRTGQLQTLGEIEVTDAMIRAARGGRR